MEISNQRNKLEEIQNLNALLEKKAFEDELTCVPNRSYINYHLNFRSKKILSAPSKKPEGC